MYACMHVYVHMHTCTHTGILIRRTALLYASRCPAIVSLLLSSSLLVVVVVLLLLLLLLL